MWLFSNYPYRGGTNAGGLQLCFKMTAKKTALAPVVPYLCLIGEDLFELVGLLDEDVT